jgi:ABC-type glucose/galactose transport system permease subunit
VACGTAAAFAGAMLASTLSTGQIDQVPNIALDSIAAVVIGGTSLYGGEGAMWRTAVGVLILSTMSTDWTSATALTDTQNLLQAHPDVNTVLLAYGGELPGVVQAVKSAGMSGKVKVFDIGGSHADKAASAVISR